MPQSNQTGEFNTFVGGLVTEASPLTFPENASIDEANFELNRNGSRSRRFGMDFEPGLTPYPISYGVAPLGNTPRVSVYQWQDVAGIPSKAFVVLQIHDRVYIIDRADSSLAGQSYVKQTFLLCNNCIEPSYASFAAVNGLLVIAYGEPELKVIKYDPNTDSLTEEEEEAGRGFRIKTRDLFGVADMYNNGGEMVNLLSPEYINLRPQAQGVDLGSHIYNLRNQGWAVPRADWDDNTAPIAKTDPIRKFETEGATYRGLPSNADTPVTNIYPDTSKADKNTERFDDNGSFNNEPAKSRAATGHFIIDLLERGASREKEVSRLTDTTNGLYANANPGSSPVFVDFRTPTITFNQDKTDGGATVVSEYAGRIFYAGFSSQNIDGDSQSPNLASYVFFSQVVKDSTQIARCFQEGDPTGTVEPDLLDTDGGFIRLAGAYNIQQMIEVGPSLLVFAENGVWAIGGSDTGVFTANNQSVSKVTEHGTIAPQSVILVDSTVMYWADDAIYHVTRDQFGSWVAKELSTNIRTFYQEISSDDKAASQGVFDSYTKKARWIYSNRASGDGTTRELVFDLVLAAFSVNTISQDVAGLPIPIAPVEVPPFNVSKGDLTVLSNLDEVFSDVDPVVVSVEQQLGGFRETAYLTILGMTTPDSSSFTFSSYNNDTFKDWELVDGIGVDSPAYMLTGYISNGDLHRQKQIPYIYFHFNRTEDGFVLNGDDLTPTNQSSCLVQAQWDWANSPTIGKWGKQFQAYRYKRHYTPEDVFDTYDYGTSTIVSRNKLRGRGRVVSFLITSEEGKDMQLLGWSMTIGMNSNG